VARVSAASGEVPVARFGVKGARPDHAPRAEMGDRKTVQLSVARRW